MLTIERPSPASNKLVIATIVFAVGFIGSLTTLGIVRPGLDPVAFGRPRIAASRANSSPSGNTETSSSSVDTSKQGKAAGTGTSDSVKPVASVPVDSPASSYADSSSGSGQPSSSGTVQLSGQMPATSANQPTSTASTPVVSTQPSVPSTVTQPAVPPASSPTSPITSLTQQVTDTTGNLVPSLCSC